MVQDRVIGILDWELSTLGNQMCDVAYSCLVITIYMSICSLLASDVNVWDASGRLFDFLWH